MEYCTAHFFEEHLDYTELHEDGYSRSDIQKVTFTAPLKGHEFEKYGKAVRMSRWSKYFDVHGDDISYTFTMQDDPIKVLFLLSLIRPLEEYDEFSMLALGIMNKKMHLSASQFVILCHVLSSSSAHMVFQPLNRLGGLYNHLKIFDRLMLRDPRGFSYDQFDEGLNFDVDGDTPTPEGALRHSRLVSIDTPEMLGYSYADPDEVIRFLKLPTEQSSFKDYA